MLLFCNRLEIVSRVQPAALTTVAVFLLLSSVLCCAMEESKAKLQCVDKPRNQTHPCVAHRQSSSTQNLRQRLFCFLPDDIDDYDRPRGQETSGDRGAGICRFACCDTPMWQRLVWAHVGSFVIQDAAHVARKLCLQYTVHLHCGLGVPELGNSASEASSTSPSLGAALGA